MSRDGAGRDREGRGPGPLLLVPSSAQGLCAPPSAVAVVMAAPSSLERGKSQAWLKGPGLREALDGPRGRSAQLLLHPTGFPSLPSAPRFP